MNELNSIDNVSVNAESNIDNKLQLNGFFKLKNKIQFKPDAKNKDDVNSSWQAFNSFKRISKKI